MLSALGRGAVGCRGEAGKTETAWGEKELHYVGSKIHKITRGEAIYGGDIEHGDGSGESSASSGVRLRVLKLVLYKYCGLGLAAD